MPGGRVNGQTIGLDNQSAKRRFIRKMRPRKAQRRGSSPKHYAPKRYKKAGRNRRAQKKKGAKHRKHQRLIVVAGRDGHTSCRIVKRVSSYAKKLLRGGNHANLGPMRVFTDQYDQKELVTAQNGFTSKYLIPTKVAFDDYVSTPSLGGVCMYDFFDRFRQMRTDFNTLQAPPINITGQYMFFKSCTTTYTISNHSNVGCTVIIYDCTAKRDMHKQYIPSTAGTVVDMKSDPLQQWEIGLNDTFISATGTGGISDLGASPNMSKPFMRGWHMDCTTHIHLGPNSTVKHTVHFEPNRLWEPNFDAREQTLVTGVLATVNGPTYVAGLSHCTFMRAHTDPVYQTETLAQNFAAIKLLVLTNTKIHSKVCTPTIRKVYARGNTTFGTVTASLTGEAGQQDQNVAVVSPV